MKNKIILITTMAIASIACGVGGFFAGRRSMKPKNANGILIIDHQGNPPEIYLDQLDESVMEAHHPILLEVKHYYKKSRK